MALHLLDLVESLAELRDIGSPVPESSRALQVRAVNGGTFSVVIRRSR
jgi:hypothetical protein